MTYDPVCGMAVDESSEPSFMFRGGVHSVSARHWSRGER